MSAGRCLPAMYDADDIDAVEHRNVKDHIVVDRKAAQVLREIWRVRR